MRGVRRLLAVAAAGGAVIVVGPVGAAWAAPPSNDSFSGATVIASVPFSTTEDTSQATLGSDDAAVGLACPGAPFTFSSSVWFAYTPATDQQVKVDTAGSSYTVAGAVVTGTPASFSRVSCFVSNTSFAASAGTTYYIDVLQTPAGSGGTLSLSVVQQFPPNPTLTVDSTGAFDPRTGDATVSGTASCAPGAFGEIGAALTQPVGRITTITGFAPGFASVMCDGTPHPWSLLVVPNSGMFRGGHATASVDMTSCTYICAFPQVTQTIQLKH